MFSKKTDTGGNDRSLKTAIYVVAAVEAVGLAAFFLIKALF